MRLVTTRRMTFKLPQSQMMTRVRLDVTSYSNLDDDAQVGSDGEMTLKLP